ncbi:MAG: Spy/CpxP family protein refolding chaperone [Burkholderiales bacterium]
MNAIHRVLLALATALPMAAALPVAAQQGSAPGQYGQRIEQRLADLKMKLAITGGQETQWQAFEAQVRQETANARAARQSPPQDVAAAPDRLARRAELMKQRSAGLEAIAGALKDLYQALSADQRAIIDQHYAQLESRGRGRHGPMQRS